MTPKKYFCILIKHGIATILSAPTEDYEEAMLAYKIESEKYSGVMICETVYG